MKRIVIILVGITLLAAGCRDNNENPEPGPNPVGKGTVSLNVYVPKGGISTYAGEDGSSAENRIDTLFVDLYENNSASSPVLLSDTFAGNKLTHVLHDSIYNIAFEVDNMTAGAIAKVYANRRAPKALTGEIDVPDVQGTSGDPKKSFYMSGQATSLTMPSGGTNYEGKASLVRNVAKVRVKLSKHPNCLPTDLGINLSGVKIEVMNVATNTSSFDGETLSSVGYINYPARQGIGGSGTLRPASSSYNFAAGGQIDSCYIYENQAPFGDTNQTKVKITLPTTSTSEGNKTAEQTYVLTTMGHPTIKRNYIYTLDIKVRGQSLEPLITLDIAPWDDVEINGNVLGTYLTTSVSDIEFKPNGANVKAEIDFCTDAQALYFDFVDFPVGFFAASGGTVTTGGIDHNPVSSLLPDGFQTTGKNGQILMHQGHCGKFSFECTPSVASSLGGRIRVKAGNIIKYFNFPQRKMYDAHFIVGEPILPGDQYVSAVARDDNGAVASWLQVSTSSSYTTTGAGAVTSTYPGPAAANIYLHLEENLTGATRSGTVTLKTSGNAEKKVYISQLSAIRIGDLEGKTLYTEQLHEYSTMPQYATGTFSITSYPSLFELYDGKKIADAMASVTLPGGVILEAIKECINKNRSTSDIKWYMPAQAELMAMWVAYNSDSIKATLTYTSTVSTDGFERDGYYWSATANRGSSNNEAQYMYLKYGNVGHKLMNLPTASRHWTRCVRRDGSVSSIVQTGTDLILSFVGHMNQDAYTNVTKVGVSHNEDADPANLKLFQRLQVASVDEAGGEKTWSEANTACTGKGTGWRLPTQRELQVIWILQPEIQPAQKLNNYYYWSGTGASETSGNNAWIVFGASSNTISGAGNTPHTLKTQRAARVRCVKELP